MTRFRTRAITLVEVLVTLACITLLLALSIPALGRFGVAARSSACSANLRQLAFATMAYATINAERLPPAILHFSTPGGVTTVAWDATLKPGGVVEGGPLAPYIEDADGLRQCPDHHGPTNFGGDSFSGYNYNTTYLGAEGVFPYHDASGTLVDGWAAARLGVPAALHRRPASTALFADAGFVGGANRFMRAPSNAVEFNLSLVYAGGQAFRHAGGCNVAHLDGHCSACIQPREGVNATPTLLRNVMGFPRNGFLSEDDDAYDPR